MLSAGIWHRLAGCQSFLIFCCLHTHTDTGTHVFSWGLTYYSCVNPSLPLVPGASRLLFGRQANVSPVTRKAHTWLNQERWQLRQAQKTLKPPLYTFTYTFSFHKYIPHFTLALMCHTTRAFCQTLEEVGLLLIPVCVLQSFTANKKSDWQQVSARFPLSLLMSAQTVFLNSNFSALRKYTSQDINKK